MLRPQLAIVIAAGALLAGCGFTEIDSGKAEDFVKRSFSNHAKSVMCPDGVEAKAGGTLTCQAVDARGRRYDVVLHIVDDNGRVKVGTGDVRPVR